MDALIGGNLFVHLVPIDSLVSCAGLDIFQRPRSLQCTLSINRMDKSHIRYVTERPYVENIVLFSHLDGP